LEHVFDTENFLQECHRILDDNGILIITTPNLATLHDRIKFIFGLSPRDIDATHSYLKTHVRHFTYQSISKVLKHFNFKIKYFYTNVIDFRVIYDFHITLYF